ncbi:MAG: DUF3822 family protein [Bacteroidota bacterium]
MESTTVSYKLIKKIKDDKFDVDELQHYNLLLNVGFRDFQVCIVDSRTNRCLLLEDYILAKVSSNTDLIEVLKGIFEGHHLLLAGFWKNVRIAFKNNQFALVPSPIFDSEHVFQYLKLNANIDTASDEPQYYKNIKSNSVTAFAIDKELAEWFRQTYPNLKIGFLHQASAMIEGVLNYAKDYDSNRLFIYIDRFKLHIISVKNNEVEYYNQFSIKQFSDYIKYIMLVLKSLNKDQNTSNIIIWGYIGRQSPHYNEFYKYINNIAFGERPDYLKFSYLFDEVQDHHFFDLYSMYLCD